MWSGDVAVGGEASGGIGCGGVGAAKDWGRC